MTRDLQEITSSGELTEIKLGGETSGHALLTTDEINTLVSDYVAGVVAIEKVHLTPGEPVGPNAIISTSITIPANCTITDILFETDAANVTFTGAGELSEVAQPPVSTGYMTSWVMLDGSPSFSPPNFYSARDAGRIRLIKKSLPVILYIGYSQFNGTYLNVIVRYSNYNV